MEDNLFTSPKVVNGPPKWEKRLGGRRVLVPTPLLVDELIRKVGKRKLITIKQIREQPPKVQDFAKILSVKGKHIASFFERSRRT